MKKSVLFLVPMIAIAVLLFMFGATGIKVHIILSVVGLLLLVGYTLATKKTWKSPALEIVTRLFYAVALITGVVIMNVHGIALIAIVHKASAALFALLLIVCEIHKAVSK